MILGFFHIFFNITSPQVIVTTVPALDYGLYTLGIGLTGTDNIYKMWEGVLLVGLFCFVFCLFHYNRPFDVTSAPAKLSIVTPVSNVTNNNDQVMLPHPEVHLVGFSVIRGD